MNEIYHRVSIRKYEDRDVEPEKIEAILRAAMAVFCQGIRTETAGRVYLFGVCCPGSDGASGHHGRDLPSSVARDEDLPEIPAHQGRRNDPSLGNDPVRSGGFPEDLHVSQRLRIYPVKAPGHLAHKRASLRFCLHAYFPPFRQKDCPDLVYRKRCHDGRPGICVNKKRKIMFQGSAPRRRASLCLFYPLTW